MQSGMETFVPCALVVKEPISPLLVLLRYVLRLFMSLKPCLILFVETPTLGFERLGGKILLIRTLAVIEDIEQRVRINSSIQVRIIDYDGWFLRVEPRSAELGLWYIITGPL